MIRSVSDREFGSDNTNEIVLLSDYCVDGESKSSEWEMKSCGYA